LRQSGADLQRLAIFRASGKPVRNAGEGVEVRIERVEDGWQFEYFFALPGLCVPVPSATPTRRDELWRSTCAECFVRVGTSAYLEFNFSPSGDWAAYFFDDYRKGMRAHRWAGDEDAQALRVRFDTLEGETLQEGETPQDAVFCLRVWMPFAAVTVAASGLPISLCVVTETTAGLQYWALRHPRAGEADGARPDFHHPGGFVGTLPPGEHA